jgi:hypothetical protein
MPHCIVLLFVFHLNLNFKFNSNAFECISFSLSLFSFFARPISLVLFSFSSLRPSPTGFFLPFFSPRTAQPSWLLSLLSLHRARPVASSLAQSARTPAAVPLPLLSLIVWTHPSGSSPTSSQTRARARVRLRHDMAAPLRIARAHTLRRQWPPYKTPPRALEPVKPAVAAIAAALPSQSQPLPRHSAAAASYRQSSALQ